MLSSPPSCLILAGRRPAAKVATSWADWWILVDAHDVLEPRHPAALDQRRVARPGRAQQRHRVVDALDPGRAVEVGLVADDLDAQLLGQRRQAPVLRLGRAAQLGHEPEEGQLAAGRQRGERAQRRLGRGGVGVVAVDDQRGPPGRRAGPPCAATGASTAARRLGHGVEGHPAPQRRRRRGQRVRHLVARRAARGAPRRSPHGETQPKRGRSSSSSVTASARTSAVGVLPPRTRRPGSG